MNVNSRFLSAWKGEYKLIQKIWNGDFPEQGIGPSVTLSFLEKFWMTIMVFIRSLSLVKIQNIFRNYKVQSSISELYVVSWLIFLLWLLWNPFLSHGLLFTIVIYRIIDGFNYRLCILFVDRYKKKWGLRSLGRSLILIFHNYIEIIIGFSILYLNTHSIAYGNYPFKIISKPIEALYFSTVTITTVGFGDLSPITDTGKLLVILELLIGFVFVALVLGLLITGARFVKEIDSNDIKNEE